MNIEQKIAHIESRDQACELPYWSNWGKLDMPQDLLECMMDSAHTFFPSADLDLMAQADCFSDRGFDLMMSVVIVDNLGNLYSYWKQYYEEDEVDFDKFILNLRRDAQNGGWSTETDCRNICCITGETLQAYPTDLPSIIQEIKDIGQSSYVSPDDYKWLNLVLTNYKSEPEVLAAIDELSFGCVDPEELPF